MARRQCQGLRGREGSSSCPACSAAAAEPFPVARGAGREGGGDRRQHPVGQASNPTQGGGGWIREGAAQADSWPSTARGRAAPGGGDLRGVHAPGQASGPSLAKRCNEGGVLRCRHRGGCPRLRPMGPWPTAGTVPPKNVRAPGVWGCSRCGRLASDTRLAMQLQTARGHCRSRWACQPSCPGALPLAMPWTTNCSSPAVIGRGSQPVVILGGVTRSQHGA
jgi:hypothetical protein